MDANRMQLAAALQSRGNPQRSQRPEGGQMAQEGYAQRPGIPTRQGMPQPGFGGGGMQPAPGAGGAPMFGGQAPQGQMPPEMQQAMAAMRGPAPQFGGMNPSAPAPGGKPTMGVGRPMPRPMR